MQINEAITLTSLICINIRRQTHFIGASSLPWRFTEFMSFHGEYILALVDEVIGKNEFHSCCYYQFSQERYLRYIILKYSHRCMLNAYLSYAYSKTGLLAIGHNIFLVFTFYQTTIFCMHFKMLRYAYFLEAVSLH